MSLKLKYLIFFLAWTAPFNTIHGKSNYDHNLPDVHPSHYQSNPSSKNTLRKLTNPNELINPVDNSLDMIETARNVPDQEPSIKTYSDQQLNDLEPSSLMSVKTPKPHVKKAIKLYASLYSRYEPKRLEQFIDYFSPSAVKGVFKGRCYGYYGGANCLTGRSASKHIPPKYYADSEGYALPVMEVKYTGRSRSRFRAAKSGLTVLQTGIDIGMARRKRSPDPSMADVIPKSQHKDLLKAEERLEEVFKHFHKDRMSIGNQLAFRASKDSPTKTVNIEAVGSSDVCICPKPGAPPKIVHKEMLRSAPPNFRLFDSGANILPPTPAEFVPCVANSNLYTGIPVESQFRPCMRMVPPLQGYTRDGKKSCLCPPQVFAGRAAGTPSTKSSITNYMNPGIYYTSDKTKIEILDTLGPINYSFLK